MKMKKEKNIIGFYLFGNFILFFWGGGTSKQYTQKSKKISNCSQIQFEPVLKDWFIFSGYKTQAQK